LHSPLGEFNAVVSTTDIIKSKSLTNYYEAEEVRIWKRVTVAYSRYQSDTGICL
jgi:hypothetical protein